MPGPFDLNLRHLRAAEAIARHGRMGAAADAIGLSQPALTHGLGKLEAQLGARLFDRGPTGMAATAEGAILAGRVAAAFGHLAAGFRAATRGAGRPERFASATQARAFLAVADGGGFTGGGVALNLSQPAVHRAVRELEQLAGVALVERRGRGTGLTAQGRRVARAIRLARAEIAAAIAEIRPGEGGRIVIGAMPLSRAALVPRAVSRLVAERADVAVAIVEGSWPELVEPLRDGLIDAMVGAVRAPVPDLAQTPLLDDRPVVVASARHPLAGGVADAGQLAAYPWIVGREGSPLRAHWEGLFAGAAPPRRPIECGSAMAIREMLLCGDYLTLLARDQMTMEVRGGVLARIATTGLPAIGGRTIGVITRASWRPTAAQDRLLALLRAVADELRRDRPA